MLDRDFTYFMIRLKLHILIFDTRVSWCGKRETGLEGGGGRSETQQLEIETGDYGKTPTCEGSDSRNRGRQKKSEGVLGKFGSKTRDKIFEGSLPKTRFLLRGRKIATLESAAEDLASSLGALACSRRLDPRLLRGLNSSGQFVPQTGRSPMALVILPCDLPHWSSLQKQLAFMSTATTAKCFVEGMLKIHSLCNISTGLDPDEPENLDPNMYSQLENFLTNLSNEEQNYFYKKILPIMTKRALELKSLKPGNGFHFSLQQQGDEMVYRRSFLASLLAHSFFSTFPKRTWKTHPTLQDFNFTFFFKFLDQGYQQAKLKSVFYYFELLEGAIDENECVTFSRQVMPGKQWLTIDDWLESCHPLCPIAVRNEGLLGEAEPQCLRICFSSSKIGGSVLQEGTSQESIEFCTAPELLCILASVEALEDNEVFLIKDVYQVSRINEPRKRAVLEKFKNPLKVHLCCMDAENYTRLPLGQLEEDNVLRELNKALLGFRQGKASGLRPKANLKAPIIRRLSPIGESFSSTPRENALSKDGSPSVHDGRSPPFAKPDSPARRKVWLRPQGPHVADAEGRRGRFIVLGSSGECLPVTRNQTFLAGKRDILSVEFPEKTTSNKDSLLSSAQSDDEDESDQEDSSNEDEDIFLSARTSLDNDKEEFNQSSSKSDEGYPKPNTTGVGSISLDEERRYSFAERLREALLRGARTYSASSDESSYAVGISVHGSADEDVNVRCKRGTSTGFMLQEESLDDGFYQDSLEQVVRHEGNQSDNYSFTTEGSDLEDVFDQLSKWINSGNNNSKPEKSREETISEFASCLLKRAFSDSCAAKGESPEDKKRTTLVARSFSLEIVKKNPKLAAQLMCLLSKKDASLMSLLPNKNGQRPVATGNWGCGSCHGGDPQVKLTIQWLAASYTGLPNLIYYTSRHHKLVKLDTVRRVLVDRGWTVGQLTSSLLQYAQSTLNDSQSCANLFDVLITSSHS